MPNRNPLGFGMFAWPKNVMVLPLVKIFFYVGTYLPDPDLKGFERVLVIFMKMAAIYFTNSCQRVILIAAIPNHSRFCL